MQKFIETVCEDLLDKIQLIKIYISSILMKNMSDFFEFYKTDVLNMKPIYKLQFVITSTTVYSSSIQEYFTAYVYYSRM